MIILLVVDGYDRPWLQYFRPVAIAGMLLTISLNNHAAAVPKPFLPVRNTLVAPILPEPILRTSPMPAALVSKRPKGMDPIR